MPALRIVLELDPGPGATPYGRLIAAAGEPVRFAGWIELAAALEQVLVAAPEEPPAGLSGGVAPD